MEIVREEITRIPITEDGKKFAGEYAERLKKQNLFISENWYQNEIIIKAVYNLTVEYEVEVE